MASLLRLRRRCDACSVRAMCSLFQLLQPRRHDYQPFFEWHQAWLCPPCQAPLMDLFRHADHQVVEISAASS